MLSRREIGELAVDIRSMLADADVELSPVDRARWEGALTAAETILGERSSLLPDGLAAAIRSLLSAGGRRTREGREGDSDG